MTIALSMAGGVFLSALVAWGWQEWEERAHQRAARPFFPAVQKHSLTVGVIKRGGRGAALGFLVVYWLISEPLWVALAGGALGFVLPLTIEWERKRKRREEMFRRFPEFLDLLLLALSAGYHLEEAWRRAGQFLGSGPLKERLMTVLEDREAGRTWEAAFRNLKEGLGDPRYDPALSHLLQGVKQGVGLEEALSALSQYYDDTIRNSMERKTQTAPVRMLFPIVFFILPTLFLLLFGPLIIQIKHTGSLF